MTDFLTRLVQREFGAVATVRPRTPSRFAPSDNWQNNIPQQPSTANIETAGDDWALNDVKTNVPVIPVQHPSLQEQQIEDELHPLADNNTLDPAMSINPIDDPVQTPMPSSSAKVSSDNITMRETGDSASNTENISSRPGVSTPPIHTQSPEQTAPESQTSTTKSAAAQSRTISPITDQHMPTRKHNKPITVRILETRPQPATEEIFPNAGNQTQTQNRGSNVSMPTHQSQVETSSMDTEVLEQDPLPVAITPAIESETNNRKLAMQVAASSMDTEMLEQSLPSVAVTPTPESETTNRRPIIAESQATQSMPAPKPDSALQALEDRVTHPDLEQASAPRFISPAFDTRLEPDAPSVNINIDRIEVQAPPPQAAPARPRRKRSRPNLSLQDFLSRRRRRRA